MKKFNKIVMKNKELNGIGYYQKVSDGLIIEAEDASILKPFIDVIRDTAFIGSISFEGLESNGAFAGDFLVSNISSNTITLIKI